MLVVGHGDMRKWAVAGLMQSGEPADLFVRVAEQHPRLGQIILQLAVTCGLLAVHMAAHQTVNSTDLIFPALAQSQLVGFWRISNPA